MKKRGRKEERYQQRSLRIFPFLILCVLPHILGNRFFSPWVILYTQRSGDSRLYDGVTAGSNVPKGKGVSPLRICCVICCWLLSGDILAKLHHFLNNLVCLLNFIFVKSMSLIFSGMKKYCDNFSQSRSLIVTISSK